MEIMSNGFILNPMNPGNFMIPEMWIIFLAIQDWRSWAILWNDGWKQLTRILVDSILPLHSQLLGLPTAMNRQNLKAITCHLMPVAMTNPRQSSRMCRLCTRSADDVRFNTLSAMPWISTSRKSEEKTRAYPKRAVPIECITCKTRVLQLNQVHFITRIHEVGDLRLKGKNSSGQ
jgi:hypothetical protein